MPPRCPRRPPFCSVALFGAVFVVCLQSGRAPAEALGSGLALETALPWSVPPTNGFHLSDRSLLSPEGPGSGSRRFRLDLSGAFGSSAFTAPADGEDRWGLKPPPGPGVGPRRDHSRIIAGGFTALFLGLEYAAFWSSGNMSSKFVVANEGWFGETSYVGGADKASHLVGGYIAGRLLSAGLEWGGSPPEKSSSCRPR